MLSSWWTAQAGAATCQPGWQQQATSDLGQHELQLTQATLHGMSNLPHGLQCTAAAAEAVLSVDYVLELQHMSWMLMLKASSSSYCRHGGG